MKLIAGLVAALVILGIVGLVLIKGPSSSSKVDPTPEPVSEVAPAPAPSPTTESIRPLSGTDTGGKCINPPLNTICVR
jgi:hypothetical protein